MRRSDREIKDFKEIVAVLEKCDACRLALNDEGYPYIVPLSFGMQTDDGVLTLYFHSALQGTKLDLIAKDNRASFEADCSHRIVFDEEKGSCTTEYESVVGRGLVYMITDEAEKKAALDILMRHYRGENFEYNPAVIPITATFKLTVQSVTGKRRFKKQR